LRGDFHFDRGVRFWSTWDPYRLIDINGMQQAPGHEAMTPPEAPKRGSETVRPNHIATMRHCVSCRHFGIGTWDRCPKCGSAEVEPGKRRERSIRSRHLAKELVGSFWALFKFVAGLAFGAASLYCIVKFVKWAWNN
jgi:hypothetical protein